MASAYRPSRDRVSAARRDSRARFHSATTMLRFIRRAPRRARRLYRSSNRFASGFPFPLVLSVSENRRQHFGLCSQQVTDAPQLSLEGFCIILDDKDNIHIAFGV